MGINQSHNKCWTKTVMCFSHCDHRKPWERVMGISLKRWPLSSDLKEFINKSQAQRGGKGVLSRRNSICIDSREGGSILFKGGWKVTVARVHRTRRLGWKQKSGTTQGLCSDSVCLKGNGKPLRCLSRGKEKVVALSPWMPHVVLWYKAALSWVY